MTENEMKTKWCPFARGADFKGPSYNRQIDGAPSIKCKCITLACAAWRWNKVPNPNYNPQSMNIYPQPFPPTPMYIDSTTDGYCGLAGVL